MVRTIKGARFMWHTLISGMWTLPTSSPGLKHYLDMDGQYLAISCLNFICGPVTGLNHFILWNNEHNKLYRCGFLSFSLFGRVVQAMENFKFNVTTNVSDHHQQ